MKRKARYKISNLIIAVFFICSLSRQAESATGTAKQNAGPRQQKIGLSLSDVSRIALENNLDVQIAKYDAYIRRTDLANARAIYDTMLCAQASYLDDQRGRTSTIFGTKATTQDYTLGLAKKTPLGTTIGLDFEDQRDFSNSTFASVSPAHDASVKFSMHQPLGRNFFGLIDRGNVKITKLEVENSDQEALQRIESALARAQEAYWRLVLRTREIHIAQEMLEKADTLYQIFKKKEEIGLVEGPELFAAEANVTQRKASLKVIELALVLAKNELLLLLHEEDLKLEVVPQNMLAGNSPPVSMSESLQKAIAGRRDYKQAKNNVDNKNILLRMKKNALWPEIDLEASFLRNGLAASQKKAWADVTDKDNPELYAGLIISVPLENSSAKSQHRRAKYEKAKALLELKKTEHKIAVDISNTINALNNKREKIRLNERIVLLQEKKLALEEERFGFGRSESDTLIRYQEDLLQAKLVLAQTLFEYKGALIGLKRAENSLLDEYWQGKL